MLHTPLKHIHPPSVGAGSHPSPAHPQATASPRHALARCSPIHAQPSESSNGNMSLGEMNLADWLHVSPSQASLMSPTHTHSLTHALPLHVVGPYSPYAPTPSPYTSPSSHHLHQQQPSSPYYFPPSPLHQSTSSAFAPSGYGRNDFLAPPTSTFSTPTNISIQAPSRTTTTATAITVGRKASLETSERSPIVDVPLISVSSSETDEDRAQGGATDSAYAYNGFFERADAMGFSDFSGFTSSSMHPQSVPMSPIDYHNNDPRSLSSLTPQGSQKQDSQVTTLTAYDENHTQRQAQQPCLGGKVSLNADGRDLQQHTSLLEKLRAASPVTEVGGSSAGSTPAPHSTFTNQQSQRQDQTEASHATTSSPSPFLAAPVPRAHPNTAHASLTHLSCPSPLSRGSSPLAELAELASRRSSAASSPLTPLPPSIQSANGPALRTGEGIVASVLEKSLAEALAHQLPLSRPTSRSNSALSVRSTQSTNKHHSPSRGTPVRKSHSHNNPFRPKRFPLTPLRVSLPFQPSHPANNTSLRERDASVETAHLPRGPLDPVSTSGYATRSRGSRSSAEELEKKEREADLELIKLGASSASKEGGEDWGLAMLATVSASRRLGVDPPHLHLTVGEREREGRWSRASSLTPLSSSVATPSPVMGPSTSRGRQTRGVKRGFSEEMHHIGSGGERDGSAKKSKKPIEKVRLAKSASRSSSVAAARGKGGKNTTSSTSKARSASAKTKSSKQAANTKRAEIEDDEETEVEVLDDEDLDAEGETVEEDEQDLDLDAEGEEDDELDGDAMELDGDGDYEPSPASVRGRVSGSGVGKKAAKASIPKAGAGAKTKANKKAASTEKEKKRPAPRKAASARSVTASRPNAKSSRAQSSSSANNVSTSSSFKSTSHGSTPSKDQEPDTIDEVDLGTIDIPTRHFPEGVPVHANFSLLYRRFPACSFVGGVSVTSENGLGQVETEMGREGALGRNARVFKVSTPVEGMGGARGVETFVTTSTSNSSLLSTPMTNAASSSYSTQMPSQSSSSNQSNSSSTRCDLPHVEPPSTGHFNTHAPLGPNDLYTPRFVRGVGREKAGLCPICYEPESRGGQGKQEWLSMKFSAFNYHMQYFHGVSPQTFLPFSPPVAFRYQRRAPTYRNEKSRILEGKCHSCGTWAAVEGIKCVEAKLKEIYWWKHAASCHKGSTLPGEHGAVMDDAVLERVEAAYARMFPLDPPPRRA